jgi:hypothetical protein
LDGDVSGPDATDQVPFTGQEYSQGSSPIGSPPGQVLFRLSSRSAHFRLYLDRMIDDITLFIHTIGHPWIGHHLKIGVDLSIEQLSLNFKSE